MNHPQYPTPLLQLESIKQKITWRQRRLQQFADRAGLSLLQVQVLLLDKARVAFLDKEIDRNVDAEYQTINQPS